MITLEVDEVIKEAEKELLRSYGAYVSSERFKHARRVEKEVLQLATVYKCNRERMSLLAFAARWHDLARDWNRERYFQEAEKLGLAIDFIEDAHYVLLHGRIAAAIMERQGIRDEEVLAAVAYHTTGRAGMSLPEKLLFVADKIEAGRKFPGVEQIKKIAYEDLDMAVLWILDSTITYVVENGWPLHPRTVAARNDILTKVLERGRKEA